LVQDASSQGVLNATAVQQQCDESIFTGCAEYKAEYISSWITMFLPGKLNKPESANYATTA